VGPEQIAWMDRLEAEHDNLRAALSFSREGGEGELGLRLAGALWRFWYVRGHLSEGRGWCEEARAGDSGSSPSARANTLLGSGDMALRQGDYERAEQSLEESLALYRESKDGKGEARSLRSLGRCASDLHDFDRASELLSESARIGRRLGDRSELAETLNNLGVLATYREDTVGATTIYEEAQGLARAAGNIQALAMLTANLGVAVMLEGDYEKARALMDEAMELTLALKDGYSHALILHNLGLLALLRGEPDEAAVLLAQSMETCVDLLDRIGVTLDLDALAAVAGERGDTLRAVRLWGAAEALRDAMGVPQPDDEAMVVGPFVEAARSRLDEAAFRNAWEEGRAMTQEQAIALALADEGHGEHAARAEPA
jgi:tetratricopeptide (TPR) repeat protein